MVGRQVHRMSSACDALPHPRRRPRHVFRFACKVSISKTTSSHGCTATVDAAHRSIPRRPPLRRGGQRWEEISRAIRTFAPPLVRPATCSCAARVAPKNVGVHLDGARGTDFSWDRGVCPPVVGAANLCSRRCRRCATRPFYTTAFKKFFPQKGYQRINVI